jgi:parvulin-like peptidyl-prolyl isomerase
MFVAGVLLLAGVVQGAESTKKPVAAPPSSGSPKPQLDYFAKVGPDTLSLQYFAAELDTAMKEKFFHGKIPEKELEDFRRQFANQLVDRTLYIQEARRRGISPNQADVERRIKDMERKKKSDTYWQEHKDQFLKSLRREYEEDSLVKQLEASVRRSPNPTQNEIQQYYKKYSDKFTAPERVKVHMILLKVDPSSSSDVWEKVSKQASELVTKIRAGENFEELARIHSGDDSAAAGGDMGYIHKGMLGENAKLVLEQMKPGALSEPVFLLEGVAIFRLDDREQARLNEFERIDETAAELLRKELGEKAWQELAQTLRRKTEIVINESVL